MGISAAGRRRRSPQHTFQVRHRPFEITPFLLAPVLPGETMKGLWLQSRAYSDPIKAPAIGWWLEYYIFYVKHRDMAERDTLTAMMIDPSTDTSALEIASTDAWKYSADDCIDWTGMCLKRVVEEYFRDEGEAWNAHVVTAGRPAAQINQRSWLDSAVQTSDIDTIADETVVDEAGAGTVTAKEIDEALRRYRFLQKQGLITMSYEDYLASFGVRIPQLEDHRPELVRYVREWTYPTNTIDPTNGTPRSAVSWVIQERASKARFFKEPGFLFGVTLARPKVYLQNQQGSAAGLMRDAYSWLPAQLQEDVMSSVINTANSEGPLQLTTNPYTADVRDLLIYGDQFVNFDLAQTDANLISLPDATLANKRYPTDAMADELFVGASPANQVRQDGIVRLAILGRQQDHTPTA